MTTRPIDQMLELLSQAPDSQIDKQITTRFPLLIGKPTEEIATGLKAILDECAFASLASDFAMRSMDHVWKMALEPTK